MSPQYGELRPTSGWYRFGSLGHPSYFQRLPRLGSVTAWQSSSERQSNFAALNRGRHLCSAGWPSRWALAHISSFISYFSQNNEVWHLQYVLLNACLITMHSTVSSIWDSGTANVNFASRASYNVDNFKFFCPAVSRSVAEQYFIY